MNPIKAIEAGPLAISMAAYMATQMLYREQIERGQLLPARAKHLLEEAQKLLLQDPGANHPDNREAAGLLDDMRKALVG